jgi:predicted regulator of Ras-like GTPase activity (Roadblock/LC7/MglB family)
MTFKAILADLLERIPGGLGAILVDWEGEAVDQTGVIDDYELKVIGAHKGLILGNLRKAVARVEGNQLQEIAITTEQVQTLILPVNEDYCLVVTLQKGEAYGRALFETQRCLAKLKQEIC